MSYRYLYTTVNKFKMMFIYLQQHITFNSTFHVCYHFKFDILKLILHINCSEYTNNSFEIRHRK